MEIIQKLSTIWENVEYPFLIHKNGNLKFKDIMSYDVIELTNINEGDVVALVGDFDPKSIIILLKLIEKNIILVPLSIDTKIQHDYFFKSALVDVVIEDGKVRRFNHGLKHKLIQALREKKHAGLVLFSTGTTGQPKAILHDLTLFMKRFETPRPTLRTLNFLLFDHIGGLNTLLHTLFNKGTVIAPKSRNVQDILSTCLEHDVEVLPATPTFLRMMLMSGLVPKKVPKNLKIITYGTERMDQTTLDEMCSLLPNVDFRQTFGMSELGIVRVKSENRNSLYMKIGGEGVSTKVVEKILYINSDTRMLGYLNAPSPFDQDGWYNTNDMVEVKQAYFKVVGRTSDVINVGGLKFMANEVEKVCLDFPDISFVKAFPRDNPITGQHVELVVQPKKENLIDKNLLISFLKEKLQPHMVPKRVKIENVPIGHRFKKL